MFIALTFSPLLFSQEIDVSSETIPLELKENANAVIRYSEITVTIDAVDKMVVREKRVVTVLNELGNSYLGAYQNYNEDQTISKLSAIMYDAYGEKIKKYSKGNFEDVSAISGGTLYSDARLKYLEYTPTAYPYTVVFETEYKNSTTAFIPTWKPLEGYNLSVEKSRYVFENLAAIPFRKKELNLEEHSISQVTEGNVVSYTMTDFPSIEYEQNAIPFDDFVPKLNIALNDFSLKGVVGSAKNWQELGKWMYDNLIVNRNTVSEETAQTIKNLVAPLSTKEEKVKAIYEFVQKKTRYISVQVDIGGWEPIAANKVDAVSYGDCKGLTNYTKALLDVAGIPSYHVIVYAQTKRDIDKDFTAMQGDHMILNVPNEGEDIWLECTSQTAPFGYLGDFTDDRDVLVITPEGGVIKRTPSYAANNTQFTNATITLHEDATLDAVLEINSTGIAYDNKYFLERLAAKESIKYYDTNVWNYLNNLEYKDLAVINDKEKVVFTEKVSASIANYATAGDANYILKTNIFNRLTSIPKRYRSRQRPLKISRGFQEIDAYTIILPDGFYLNNIPEDFSVTNEFGDYKVSYEKIDEYTFKFKREFSLNEGIFPKEHYKMYRKFIKSVVRKDNQRIELLKQKI